MLDRHGREINYMRISLTDRCNFRCIYCMPENGIEILPHSEILSLEEQLMIIKAGAELGIKKVRFTGGEPLIKKGLPWLIKETKAIPGIDDIAITTNGLLLSEMAKDLKDAGLNRVNISLDTLDPEVFKKLTRGGELGKVLKGLDTALELGLHPVKINTVILKGINDKEITALTLLAKDKPIHVRFIELMPLGESKKLYAKRYMSTEEIKEKISALGELKPAKITGNGPAKAYKIDGFQGTIGFITPVSQHFCGVCNRLRVTSVGDIKGCLHHQEDLNVRNLVRAGDYVGLKAAIAGVIERKPSSHNTFTENDVARKMYQVGG